MFIEVRNKKMRITMLGMENVMVYSIRKKVACRRSFW